ncbi:MAG: hypothetical protein SAL07_10215 [Oscillatoria sp. PMC 1051.18]|uniref:hypothetical protein n=1 Tax=Oscillatoria salina TaxID=331517 RepID=UPI0013B8B698|nr:hypothetical protein [Oscillatoria salina]MBZ8182339.1 hypothetical protein [Oscillatoria salina IIICB1]MEC4895335.1 hypothetical protein [Oscillatoria sp. PMC 1050.18]MEC5030276.1 hypothetical protein [Oscillatoria sp. PMC 1051.18]NET87912.1 hypothetical protein [Kamptonema sp. SIO1D9]
MTETAFDQFYELGLRAIALDATAFEQIQTIPLSNVTAVLFAFIAGFSQAVGQAIVLFINRVKPIRFFLSLLIAALLYAFSYIFWALSTWIASIVLFAKYPSFMVIARTLGLAYAPLSFSFLVALPYLGIPIYVILSVWSFLAFLTGLDVALGLGIWQTFWCTALGWAVFQLSQRTIGRPITWIGRWLENTVAGVKLVTDLKAIEEIVEAGLKKTHL